MPPSQTCLIRETRNRTSPEKARRRAVTAFSAIGGCALGVHVGERCRLHFCFRFPCAIVVRRCLALLHSRLECLQIRVALPPGYCVLKVRWGEHAAQTSPNWELLAERDLSKFGPGDAGSRVHRYLKSGQSLERSVSIIYHNVAKAIGHRNFDSGAFAHRENLSFGWAQLLGNRAN